MHDVLTRLKAQTQIYPTIDISYSPSKPLAAPVILNLTRNGIRLRFDGPDQRLRLIEVLDFTKTQLTYKNTDLVKLSETTGSETTPSTSSGPLFRHVYNRLMGPAFPGEYIPPASNSSLTEGLYILSYPGIAFTFPFQDSKWDPVKDFVSLLSSNAAAPGKAMAIFTGESWQDACHDLMNTPCSNPRSLALSSRGKEFRPREVDLVRIRGNGWVDMERGASTPTFRINLGRTTPQDLVAELGPPDAIYHKSDRKMAVYKIQNRDRKPTRTSSGTLHANHEDTTDTDQSSLQSATEDSDDDEQSNTTGNIKADTSTECFYNYFHHGFDIFISRSTLPAPGFCSTDNEGDNMVEVGEPKQLVATKILLHANVPGSYPFNRYRRSRWVIDAQASAVNVELNSETPFTTLSESLRQIWRNDSGDENGEDSLQRHIVLNRELAESPGSSCELLGGWEESTDVQREASTDHVADDGPGYGNTKLFGFPGLLFEVLRNDAVSCLTVY